MSKKILIFYSLFIFLINLNFIIAYHGSSVRGASVSPTKAIFMIIGGIIIFVLIIWFFRKASMNMKKKK